MPIDRIGLHMIDGSGAANGQVPVWNPDTQCWEPGTASGGGGTVDSVVAGTGISVDNTDPANPVVSATGGGGGGTGRDRRWTVGASETSIDEFNDDALAAAWVRVDGANTPAANVTWTEGADTIAGKQTGLDTGNAFHFLGRPLAGAGGAIAAGDAFITCVTLLGVPQTNYSVVGIGVTDGLTYGSGKQVLAETYFDTTTGQENATNGYTGFTTATAGQAAVDGKTPIGAPTFIRLVYLGAGVWRSDRSPNGISWINGGSITVASFTPTHVGLTTRKPGAGTTHIVAFEFLRRVSGVS